MRIFPFLLFILLSIFSFSQPNGGGMMDTAALNRMPKIGKIYGTVIDSVTKKGVDYSSVALLRNNDSSVVTGTITNDRGDFTMEGLPMGRYLIVVTSVGYKKFFSKPQLIFPRNPEVNAGKFIVSPTAHQVKEVEVTAEKQAMLNTIDKRVIDVGKSIINTGGTATEVLQNVPGVTVDIDGNVSLRGNANVIVLIDGKPSGITGSSRAAILQQLPAGSIDRIEIITNPGARYDADGMSGIINIITKKDKMKGFNVNASLGAGTNDKYNGSFGINYRVNKFNVFANYNYRSEERYGNGHSERTNQYRINGIDTLFYNDNVSNSLNNSASHVAKAGFDWYLSKATTIGFSSTLSLRKEQSNGGINYEFRNSLNQIYSKLYRNTGTSDKNSTLDYAADIKHVLRKKQELTASAALSTSNSYNKASFLNYDRNIFDNSLGGLILNQFNTTDGSFIVFTAQADFSAPIGEKRKFETGLKSTNRYIGSDFDAFNFNTSKNDFENDTLFTQHYTYQENIQAAYAQYSGITNAITWQLGLRGEMAQISGKSLLTNTPFNFSYPGLYPSALARYTLKKTNDFQFSYSRRVNRPNVRSLLPIKNFEDAFNFTVGNPELKPENINSYEFSYYKNMKQHTLGATLFYRHTTNMHTRLRTIDTLTGIATMTFRNFSTSENVGLELIVKNTIKKVIQITSNINLFQNTINGTNVDATLQSSAFNWNARTNIAGKVNKALSFQVSGFYMARTKMPQGNFWGMSGMDIGCKYDFWGTKASFTANLSDVLNTRHFEMYNFGPGFESQNYRKRETRILMVTFLYRFGNIEQQQRKKDRQREQGGEQRMEDF